MKKLLLFSFLFLSSSLLFAQPWGALKQGEMTIGGINDDAGNCIIQTNDGGYVITGSIGDSLLVVKFDYTGYSPWDKIIEMKWATGNCIIQTTDSGYAIVGGDGNTPIVIKLDKNGNPEWDKQLASGPQDGTNGLSIVQTKDGGYLVGGSIMPDVGAWSIDYGMIEKLDALGNVKWQWLVSGGNTNVNIVRSIIPTYDGGYCCTGFIQNHSIAFKIDSYGNCTWSKDINRNYYGDKTNSIIQSKDKGFVIAGSAEYVDTASIGHSNISLLKLDSIGRFKWSRTIGGLKDDEGMSVVQAKDGGYVVAGYTNSFGAGGYDMYVVKVDTGGNLLWTRTIGGTGDDYGNSIALASDGGYLITGNTNSYGAGGYDVYFVKLDSAGGLCSTTGTGGKVTSVDTAVVIDTTINNGIATPGDGTLNPSLTWGGVFTNICSVVSVNNFSAPENSITVSPNPSNGIFQLLINNYELGIKNTVEVYNVLGEQIYSQLSIPIPITIGTQFSIDLENQPAGIYFYRVLCDGKFVGSGKLVIEK